MNSTGSAAPLPRDPIAEAQRNWERHGWQDAAAPMAAITAIMRTQQILLLRIESVLKPFGLKFARYELLALLSFSKLGKLPMNKASALLQVHPTSVTNAVDRLQQAGLVLRSPHPTDGRATLIELTRRVVPWPNAPRRRSTRRSSASPASTPRMSGP